MLNAAQEKAVLCTEGRLLVLAGAGSGKTRVIVHRIAHLIRNKRVSPQSILGLTFTNKAAAEMRERLESLIGAPEARQTTLSTFHSFCMQALRREIGRLGYTRDFTLYDERDMDRIIKQLARDILGIAAHQLLKLLLQLRPRQPPQRAPQPSPLAQAAHLFLRRPFAEPADLVQAGVVEDVLGSTARQHRIESALRRLGDDGGTLAREAQKRIVVR